MIDIKRMKKRQSEYYDNWLSDKSIREYDEKHCFENYQGINFNIPESLNKKVTVKEFFDEWGIENCRSCSNFKPLYKHPENTIFEGEMKEFAGIFRCDATNCIIEHSTLCDNWKWNGEV